MSKSIAPKTFALALLLFVLFPLNLFATKKDFLGSLTDTKKSQPELKSQFDYYESMDRFELVSIDATVKFADYTCGRFKLGNFDGIVNQFKGNMEQVWAYLRQLASDPTSLALLGMAYFSPTTAAFIEDFTARLQFEIDALRADCQAIDDYISGQTDLGRRERAGYHDCVRKKMSSKSGRKMNEEAARNACNNKDEMWKEADHMLAYLSKGNVNLTESLSKYTKFDYPTGGDKDLKNLLKVLIGEIDVKRAGVRITNPVPVQQKSQQDKSKAHKALIPLINACITRYNKNNPCSDFVVKKLQRDKDLTYQAFGNEKRTPIMGYGALQALSIGFAEQMPGVDMYFNLLKESIAKVIEAQDTYFIIETLPRLNNALITANQVPVATPDDITIDRKTVTEAYNKLQEVMAESQELQLKLIVAVDEYMANREDDTIRPTYQRNTFFKSKGLGNTPDWFNPDAELPKRRAEAKK